jgi:hypothetical protein
MVVIEYKEAELEKLDFRGLVEDNYKKIIRDELFKENLFLDYITTDKKITDTDGLRRATNEQIINIKRKIILNETI